MKKIQRRRKKLEKETKQLSEQLDQATSKLKVQEEMIGVLNDTVKEAKGQLEEEKKKSYKIH